MCLYQVIVRHLLCGSTGSSSSSKVRDSRRCCSCRACGGVCGGVSICGHAGKKRKQTSSRQTVIIICVASSSSNAGSKRPMVAEERKTGCAGVGATDIHKNKKCESCAAGNRNWRDSRRLYMSSAVNHRLPPPPANRSRALHGSQPHRCTVLSAIHVYTNKKIMDFFLSTGSPQISAGRETFSCI